MCNLRHIFKNVLLGILMLVTAGMYAQEDRLIRAQQLYRAKNTDLAVATIDSVVADPQTKNDFVSWSTRAFIYFDAYKRTDKFKLNSPLRDTILSSLRMSEVLKADSFYIRQNKSLYKNLAYGYFNLSKSLLEDSVNLDRSLLAYSKFKDISRQADDKFNSAQKDLEYNLVVGSIFSDIFSKDSKNTKAQEAAKVALLKVMEIQPDNAAANMNLGLMYYNQAVNIIKELDEGVDFEAIDIAQENVVKLGKQAEQFIYKVWMQDNKNVKAATALFYIYRLMLDIPKSNEYKKKAEELGAKFEESDSKKEGETKDKEGQGK